MNASGTNQPPDGTYSTNDASRRTFLKGVGLAGAAGLVGAAGLTSPFLAAPSALASGNLVLGIAAPGPWEDTNYAGYVSPLPPHLTWPGLLPNALGCRSYVPDLLKTDADVRNVLGYPKNTGAKPRFPGWDIVDEAGNHIAVKPLASIHPHHTELLNGDMDGAIKDMILDGAQRAANQQTAGGPFAGAPRLTVWHEAGHLYGGTDLDPVDNGSGVPTNAAAAAAVRAMHVKMQNLVNDVNNANPKLPNVTYGCIIFGDVNKMANDNLPLDGPTNWIPSALDGAGSAPNGALDWYGIDLYYEGDGTGTDCTHPDLATYDLVSSHLKTFRDMAKGRSGSQNPVIHITECNANASHDAERPGYFSNLAKWLTAPATPTGTNGGASPHLLTFFPQGGGPHSIQWGGFADGGWQPPPADTVQALQNIQQTYG